MIYPYPLLAQLAGDPLHAQQWNKGYQGDKSGVRNKKRYGHQDSRKQYQSPEQYVFLFHLGE